PVTGTPDRLPVPLELVPDPALIAPPRPGLRRLLGGRHRVEVVPDLRSGPRAHHPHRAVVLPVPATLPDHKILRPVPEGRQVPHDYRVKVHAHNPVARDLPEIPAESTEPGVAVRTPLSKGRVEQVQMGLPHGNSCDPVVPSGWIVRDAEKAVGVPV